MSHLRLLAVTFDTHVPAREVSAFRGAVIERVGQEHDLFHNHDNDPNSAKKYHYRYPLVQYKLRRGKPTLVFLHQGVDEAQHFFSQPDWSLTFAGRAHQLKVQNLFVKQWQLQLTETPIEYSIRKWLPLNQRNFETYQQLADLSERIAFLEKRLIGHIHAFASGIDWQIDGWITPQITELLRQYPLKHKRVSRLAFDFRFKVNLVLPPLIGLGKGVSHGYGTLYRYQPQQISSSRNNTKNAR